jgi:hypothetical protein
MRSVFAAFVLMTGFAGVALADDKAAGKHGDKAASPPAAAAGEPAAKPDKAAATGKPVTLAGVMTCAKCSLGEGTKCQNVLKVKKAGKEEKYYLAANEVAEKNHDEVCSGEAKATVKGTVAEEEGKKVLTASSIKYAKAK